MTSYLAQIYGTSAWMGLKILAILAQTVHEIYSSESVICGSFDRFLNFDDCQMKVVSDVMSGTVDQDVGMDVCANFGESRLKPSEASFSAIFRTYDNFRPEVRSDVISGVVIDPTGAKVPVKFGDSRLNRSRDIRLLHFVRTTTPAHAGHHIRAKCHKAFCLCKCKESPNNNNSRLQ